MKYLLNDISKKIVRNKLKIIELLIQSSIINHELSIGSSPDNWVFKNDILNIDAKILIELFEIYSIKKDLGDEKKFIPLLYDCLDRINITLNFFYQNKLMCGYENEAKITSLLLNKLPEECKLQASIHNDLIKKIQSFMFSTKC